MGFNLLTKNHEHLLHQDGDESKFSKDTRFDTVCATTSENFDPFICKSSKTRTHFEVKSSVAERSSSKIDQDEPDPSNNWETKLEDV